MIRIVTAGTLHRLEQEAEQARTRGRRVQEQADAALSRHAHDVRELTERAESAESDAAILRAHLAEAEERVRLLEEELEAESMEGRTLTVLLHYGEPHTIYASRADAHADIATHGVARDGWVPSGERPPADCRWRCEAFIYDVASNGFRRAYPPVARPVGEAA